jgi:hypothetical protein
MEIVIYIALGIICWILALLAILGFLKAASPQRDD